MDANKLNGSERSILVDFDNFVRLNETLIYGLKNLIEYIPKGKEKDFLKTLDVVLHNLQWHNERQKIELNDLLK